MNNEIITYEEMQEYQPVEFSNEEVDSGGCAGGAVVLALIVVALIGFVIAVSKG